MQNDQKDPYRNLHPLHLLIDAYDDVDDAVADAIDTVARLSMVAGRIEDEEADIPNLLASADLLYQSLRFYQSKKSGVPCLMPIHI